MNIQEAVRLASANSLMMYRANYNDAPWYRARFIDASNHCCLFKQLGNSSQALAWSPSADDLIAEDWEVAAIDDLPRKINLEQ